MQPDVFAIDWHTHRTQLHQRLTDCTGVVHIQEHPGAATTTFVRTLIDIWLPDRCPTDEAVVVHVDPEDAEDLNPERIAAKIVREASLPKPPPAPAAVPSAWLSGNSAGRDMNFNDNTFNVIINSYDQNLEGGPFDLVSQGLPAFLESKRLVLVFRSLEKLPETRRAALARALWVGCLVPFKCSGVLLVCAYDRWSNVLSDGSGFPPPADDTIELMPDIAVADRPGAIDDLTAISLEQGWHDTPVGARGFADGLVNGVASRSVSDMHNALQAFQTSRARDTDLDLA